MVILQAILLGIIQGLTEFIPISSSAHLVLIPWLFKWTDPALTSLSFDVALHLGTLAAVLAFFWKDWIRLITPGSPASRNARSPATRRKLAWFIVWAASRGIAGVLFESKIDEMFHQPGHRSRRRNLLMRRSCLHGLLFWWRQGGEARARYQRYDLQGLSLVVWRRLAFSRCVALGQHHHRWPGAGIQREAAARYPSFSARHHLGAGLKSCGISFRNAAGTVWPEPAGLVPHRHRVAASAVSSASNTAEVPAEPQQQHLRNLPLGAGYPGRRSGAYQGVDEPVTAAGLSFFGGSPVFYSFKV